MENELLKSCLFHKKAVCPLIHIFGGTSSIISAFIIFKCITHKQLPCGMFSLSTTACNAISPFLSLSLSLCAPLFLCLFLSWHRGNKMVHLLAIAFYQSTVHSVRLLHVCQMPSIIIIIMEKLSLSTHRHTHRHTNTHCRTHT